MKNNRIQLDNLKEKHTHTMDRISNTILTKDVWFKSGSYLEMWRLKDQKNDYLHRDKR